MNGEPGDSVLFDRVVMTSAVMKSLSPFLEQTDLLFRVTFVIVH